MELRFLILKQYNIVIRSQVLELDCLGVSPGATQLSHMAPKQVIQYLLASVFFNKKRNMSIIQDPN